MNQRQLRQLQQNRQKNRTVQIFAAPQLSEWLARTAETAQRLDDAASAWARVAEPGWLEETQVRALKDGVLDIAVETSATLYELRRRGGMLQRALSPYVRGLHRLRFVPATINSDEESPGGGSAAT